MPCTLALPLLLTSLRVSLRSLTSLSPSLSKSLCVSSPVSVCCAPRCQAKLVEDLAARNTIRTTLDPLLLALSRDYVDDKDLSSRLKKLFKAGPPPRHT